MKKHLFRITAALVGSALLVAPVMAAPADRVPATVSNPQNGTPVLEVVIPPHAVEVAPNIYSLGVARDTDGTLVEGYAFVHPRSQAAKAGRPGGGGGTCYAFLASGARWKATEPYLVNVANNDGVADVDASLAAALEEWDSRVAFEIFGSGATTTAPLVADNSSPDGLNEVYFGSIAEPGVIAVTTTWGIFSGPPSGRKLVEWDMVFDDPDFDWGDATIDPGDMDFLNIAVHEVGHAGGMGHPSDGCTEETMYRFGAVGETKKRDLNTGDIAGIQALYK